MKNNRLKKLTEKQVEESIKLYQQGISLQKIGELFNVTRQSMHDLLKRRIKLRSNKRFGKDNNFYRNTKADDKCLNIYEYALQKGILVKPVKCSLCGDTPISAKDGRSLIHGHHEDYKKPLDVIWVCQKCHYKIHVNKKGGKNGKQVS